MPKIRTSLITALLVTAWAAGAGAQPPSIWSAAAVTGTVDEAGLNIYQFNSTGSASIKSSVSSGTLDLRFPVQTLPDLLMPQQGDCPELRVNLRDTGAGARVVVRLMALSIFPGSGTALTSLGVIDSNATAMSGDPTQYRTYRTCLNTPSPGSEFLIDRAFFAYYVDAELTKSTPSANPGLMSVQICPSQDACEP